MQLFRSLLMLFLGVLLGWVMTDRGMLPLSGTRHAAEGSEVVQSSWSESCTDAESEAACSETESAAGESIKIPAGAQTIEVNIRGKYVTLYFGMPKEQVKQLLGRPGRSNLYGSGGSVREEWGYCINSEYGSDLDISFYNGKLKSVRQY